jgi:hypothetical protein
MGLTLISAEGVQLTARLESDIKYFFGSVAQRFRQYISREKHNSDTSGFDMSWPAKAVFGKLK